MTEATNDWLSLREPVDARSRSRRLADEFLIQCQRCDVIVDLACGTGSNHRFLSTLTPCDKSWLAIDNDAHVLNVAKSRSDSPNIQFERLDLANDLSRVPNGPTTAITASAFLDIASAAWLTEFAQHCRKSCLLVVMTVAGQPIWDPADECDEAIRECIEAHQQADHGFGPALGSSATSFLAQQLRHHDCQVEIAASDWHLDTQDTPLLEMMVGGVARRASLLSPSLAVAPWRNRRLEQIRRGELQLTLPHFDLRSRPSE